MYLNNMKKKTSCQQNICPETKTSHTNGYAHIWMKKLNKMLTSTDNKKIDTHCYGRTICRNTDFNR